MTNRPLTPDELAAARAAYNAIGRLYSAVGHTATLGLACAFLGSLIDNNTTDGKPLRAERAPTKDDAGKRVKVRSASDSHWCEGGVFIGFDRKGRFVVQSDICDKISLWRFCIIDEETAQ